MATGRVTQIDWTHGEGLNPAWVWIGGTRYACWQPFDQMRFCLGDSVDFEEYRATVDPEAMPVKAARHITKASDTLPQTAPGSA